jgi:threonine/homoserine/homoserine lactone efflux protein
MTDPLASALAVIVLLATPGPTNTLLAASGAGAGFAPSVHLVAAELAGYLTSILLLMLVAGPAVSAHPGMQVSLKVAAGAWLAYSAVRLWREAGDGFPASPAPIGFGRVFLTTLINPKALVFALVLFPSGPASDVMAATAAFAVLVMAAGLSWIGFGCLLAGSGAGLLTPRRISRGAAVVLAVFASLVTGSAVAVVV